MVITVTCPSCSSAFPVDPAKIPEGGVNARCTQCSDVFRIEKPADPAPEPVVELPEVAPLEEAPEEAPVAVAEEHEEAPAVEPAPADPAPAEPPAADPAPAEPPAELAATSDPFEEEAPFEQEAAEPVAAEPVAEVPPPVADAPDAEPAPAPDAGAQGFTFGKRDPADKAKRLARVLVSDMIMYNAEQHQNALAQGTLVQDFEEEIDKSWKEYVDQVGDEIAGGEGRQHWTQALNDILAKGEQVF